MSCFVEEEAPEGPLQLEGTTDGVDCHNRQQGADASPGAQASPKWDQLPAELQRSVLGTPALSLHDLARLASTCKVFKAALLERYQAEEKWLVDAAVAMFGERMIQTMLDIITTDRREFTGTSDSKTFDVSKGGGWPDKADLVSAKLVELRAPTWGLFGGNQVSVVTWGFHLDHLSEPDFFLQIDGSPDDGPYDLLDTMINRNVNAAIVPRAPGQAVPLLGVVLLACKSVAEQRAAAPEWREPGKRTLVFSTGPRWQGDPTVEQETTWSNPGEGRIDALRGLAALHMCMERCRHQFSGFYLEWYDDLGLWSIPSDSGPRVEIP